MILEIEKQRSQFVRDIKRAYIILASFGVLLIAIAISYSVVLSQSQIPEYTYIPNVDTSVHQFADYDAPQVMTVTGGQTLTLYPPFQLDELAWWGSINPNHTQWIVFASIGTCDMLPFGQFRVR